MEMPAYSNFEICENKFLKLTRPICICSEAVSRIVKLRLLELGHTQYEPG